MQNKELPQELHKPITKKIEKSKVHSSFTDNIWDADLADMQLLSKYYKGIRFLLCLIDVYSNYAQVILLKDKKVLQLLKLFENVQMSQYIKQNMSRYRQLILQQINEILVKR